MKYYENLRNQRKRKGLTIVNVAQKLEVAPATLQSWEAGRIEPPLAQLERLCTFYGIKPLDLLESPPTPEQVKEIFNKPLIDRTYQESLIATFCPPTVEKIQSSADFIRSHDLLTRFGGSISGDLVKWMQEEYSPLGGGKHDEDLVFAYHCLPPTQKAVIIRVLDAALFADHQDFLTGPALDFIRDRLKEALATLETR